MLTRGLTRRQFTRTLSAAVMSPLLPQITYQGPILDLHQHSLYSGRTHQQLLTHQSHHGIETTVLLPGEGWMMERLGGNSDCTQLQAEHRDKFVRFACADAAESRAVDVLLGHLERGAIGIGEMKFHVAVDSPEMQRVYKLAQEHGVPILIHFQYETYNTGLKRFESVLKAYPRVNFIGHAQTWWGHVSMDLNPLVMYPKGSVKVGGLTDRLLSNYPNIYGDLSAGSGLNAITRDPDFGAGFLQRHSRRLIWGSDCDCHDGQGAGTRRGTCLAEQSLSALKKLVSDEGALRHIVYENGADLLGLNRKSI